MPSALGCHNPTSHTYKGRPGQPAPRLHHRQSARPGPRCTHDDTHLGRYKHAPAVVRLCARLRSTSAAAGAASCRLCRSQGLVPHRTPRCQAPHHAHYRNAWKSPRHLSATPHTTQHTCSRHAPDNPAQSHTGQGAPRAQVAAPAMRSSCTSSPASTLLSCTLMCTGGTGGTGGTPPLHLTLVLSRFTLSSARTKHCAHCAVCTQQHTRAAVCRQAASHNNHMATAACWQYQRRRANMSHVGWMPCRLHHGAVRASHASSAAPGSTALGPEAHCWYSHAAQTAQQAVSHPKLNKLCSRVPAARSSLAQLWWIHTAAGGAQST